MFGRETKRRMALHLKSHKLTNFRVFLSKQYTATIRILYPRTDRINCYSSNKLYSRATRREYGTLALAENTNTSQLIDYQRLFDFSLWNVLPRSSSCLNSASLNRVKAGNTKLNERTSCTTGALSEKDSHDGISGVEACLDQVDRFATEDTYNIVSTQISYSHTNSVNEGQIRHSSCEQLSYLPDELIHLLRFRNVIRSVSYTSDDIVIQDNLIDFHSCVHGLMLDDKNYRELSLPETKAAKYTSYNAVHVCPPKQGIEQDPVYVCLPEQGLEQDPVHVCPLEQGIEQDISTMKDRSFTHCDVYRSEHFTYCTNKADTGAMNIKGDNSPQQPQPSQEGPTKDQLIIIQTFFVETLPDFFKHRQDYTIYHKDVVLENNYWDKHTIHRGISAYAKELIKVRSLGHLLYAKLHVQILKITTHTDDGSVRIRWRISALSQFKAMQIWKFLPWNYRKNLKEESRWFDGFSVLHVGADGLVYKHRVERVMPDEEKIKAGVESLAARIAPVLGLAPKPGLTDFSSSTEHNKKH